MDEFELVWTCHFTNLSEILKTDVTELDDFVIISLSFDGRVPFKQMRQKHHDCINENIDDHIEHEFPSNCPQKVLWNSSIKEYAHLVGAH